MTPKEIHSEIKTDFHLDYARDECSYGKGLCFTREASFSLPSYGYRLSNVNYQVLIADVFVGAACFSKSALPKEFASLFCPVQHFCVIYNNFHSYPLYLIEYSM